MILKKRCPTCDTQVEVTREFDCGGVRVTQYFCGHYVTQKILTANDIALTSSDGKTSYKFQIEGALFGLKAGGRVLILDEMGLGKTIQAEMIIHSNPDFHRFLIIGKAKLKMQYVKETIRWCGLDFMPQVIESEDDFILPFVKGFIISYDLLRRFKDLRAWVQRLGIKTVILDEVQQIKNHDSKRTNCVRQIVDGVPYLIGLSGTPIKNHGMEYFPILNMVRPDKFPSMVNFERQWVDTYFSNGRKKIGGLKDYHKFHEYTKDFIIRRTREEVMPDLPQIQRNPLFAELGPEVEQAYKDTFKQYQNAYNNVDPNQSAFQRQSNLMAYLSKMRHLTGIAKVAPCVEFVKDFLVDTDRKIIIFVHHKDVAYMVKSQLEALDYDDVPLTEWNRRIAVFAAETQDMQAQSDMFWRPDCRVAIASTLAAGEGLNLQCASDVVMLERQWNPSNEQQAEDRICRIGQTAKKLSGTYLIAVGTVDEFFAEIVERKRAMCAKSLDGKEMDWDESSLMQELMEVLAAKGGQRWGW